LDTRFSQTLNTLLMDILHFFTIKASAETIFEAIATPEGLNNWWTKKAAGTPKVGNIYQFYFTPEYDWRAKVVEVIPNKMIDWEMIEADEDWTGTHIRFELENRGDHFAIHFENTGWKSANEHFRRSNYCWAILFQGLKNYCEKEEILPFEERS